MGKTQLSQLARPPGRRERVLSGLRTTAIVIGVCAAAILVYSLIKGTWDYLDDEAGGSSSAQATDAPTPTGSAVAPVGGWTVDQAVAAVRSSTIAQVSGAPAQLDRNRVGSALAGSEVRVLLLPFSGVPDRNAYLDQVDEVVDRLLDDEIVPDRDHLVLVEGLHVGFGYRALVPSTRGGLVPVFARNDVTELVVSAIARATNRTDDSTEPAYPPPTQPADPELVTTVAQALAIDQVYTAPGVPTATRTDRTEDYDAAGVTVRIAAFPALTEGEPLVDYLTPLAARFPDDLVVVMQGGWLSSAGPDPDLQESATLYLYGEYFTQLARWGVDPVPEALVMVNRYADLRTNRAAAQAPRPAPDPVSVASRLAPWLFAALAVLAAAVTVLLSLRLTGERRARRRAERTSRDRLVGRLTAVAARLTAVDGLVGSGGADGGSAAAKVDLAAERYRVAREALDSSPAVAADALAAAEHALTAAEHALAMPAARVPS